MNALRNARKSAGLTQVRLAELLCLTQGAVAHYEAGRRVPRLNDCRRIVAVFNEHGFACTLEEVFPEVEQCEAA